MNPGSAAPYLDGFGSQMATVGYAWLTSDGYLSSAIHFGGWVEASGLNLRRGRSRTPDKLLTLLRPKPQSRYALSKASQLAVSRSVCRPTPHIDGRRIFAAIHGFDRHQHAHLRGDLDHPCVSCQARSKLAQSGGIAAFHWTRILPPPADSNSTTHSGRVDAPLPISSTNAALAGVSFRDWL